MPNVVQLSIVIPVGNDPSGLTGTLKSLKNGGIFVPEVEVIVVNDGGNKAITQVCGEYPVRMIEVVPNAGSYNARNTGIAASSAAKLGFIDAGVEACHEWHSKAIRALESADYVAGPVKLPECEKFDGAELYQSINGFAIEKKIKGGSYCPTANLAVNRHVFDAHGVFDARLRSSGDMEFGQRLPSSVPKAYDAERHVVHPFRTARQLIKKRLRVSMGHRQLYALYPERYAKLRPTFSQFFRLLLPPKGMMTLWKQSRVKIDGTSRQFSTGSFLSACVLAYRLKLAGLKATFGALRNPDSFEWNVK